MSYNGSLSTTLYACTSLMRERTNVWYTKVSEQWSNNFKEEKKEKGSSIRNTKDL